MLKRVLVMAVLIWWQTMTLGWAAVPGIASYQTVTGESLAAAATGLLRQQLGTLADQPDTIIQPAGSPRDISVPEGAVDLTARLPSGLRFNGATLVIVSVSVNGQPYLNQSLPFTVKAFTDVVVAARRLEAQEQLNDTDLRYQRWDLGHLPSGYLTDIKSASGRVSRRSQAAGSIILAKNLAQSIIVNRGQDVVITAGIGAITVTARGRALEAGGAGDVIRVQNLNSRKTVRATILSDTSVQVLSL